MPTPLFKKVRGWMGTIFQFGKDGVQLKTDGTSNIDLRNSGDTDFATMKGGTPTDDNHFVTKLYADRLPKPVIVSRQADTSTAIPPNTGVRGHVVVTRPGNGAVIGNLLWDDGSGSGLMEILPVVDGQLISVTQQLTGFDITLNANSLYQWDVVGDEWVLIGDVGGLSGSVRAIRFTFTNAASTDSVAQVPANAVVLSCSIKLTTSFSGGADIKVGNSITDDLIMEIGDNNPQKPAGHLFQVDQDTEWGVAADEVTVTVDGSPGAGAGVCIVVYTQPDG